MTLNIYVVNFSDQKILKGEDDILKENMRYDFK